MNLQMLSLQGTNTLAYLSGVLVTKKNRLTTLPPGRHHCSRLSRAGALFRNSAHRPTGVEASPDEEEKAETDRKRIFIEVAENRFREWIRSIRFRLYRNRNVDECVVVGAVVRHRRLPRWTLRRERNRRGTSSVVDDDEVSTS